MGTGWLLLWHCVTQVMGQTAPNLPQTDVVKQYVSRVSNYSSHAGEENSNLLGQPSGRYWWPKPSMNEFVDFVVESPVFVKNFELQGRYFDRNIISFSGFDYVAAAWVQLWPDPATPEAGNADSEEEGDQALPVRRVIFPVFVPSERARFPTSRFLLKVGETPGTPAMLQPDYDSIAVVGMRVDGECVIPPPPFSMNVDCQGNKTGQKCAGECRAGFIPRGFVEKSVECSAVFRPQRQPDENDSNLDPTLGESQHGWTFGWVPNEETWWSGCRVNTFTVGRGNWSEVVDAFRDISGGFSTGPATVTVTPGTYTITEEIVVEWAGEWPLLIQAGKGIGGTGSLGGKEQAEGEVPGEGAVLDCQGQGRAFRFELNSGGNEENREKMRAEGGELLLKFSGFTFLNCQTSGHGGAVSVVEKGAGLARVVIDNCTFINCTAGGYGGAFYTNTAHLVLSRTAFKRNTAAVGGAVRVYSDCVRCVVEKCEFSSNSAAGSSALSVGGVLPVASSGALHIHSTDFVNNTGSSLLSVLYRRMVYYNLSLSSSSFYYNTHTEAAIALGYDYYNNGYTDDEELSHGVITVTGSTFLQNAGPSLFGHKPKSPLAKYEFLFEESTLQPCVIYDKMVVRAVNIPSSAYSSFSSSSISSSSSSSSCCTNGMETYVFHKEENRPSQPLLPAPACQPCRQGWFAGYPNSPVCGMCAVGRFSDRTASSQCSPCPNNDVSLPGSSRCTACLPGKFALARKECTLCTRGRFTNTSGATACMLCAVGSAANAGASVCNPCPPGSVPNPSQEVCVPCGRGMSSPRSTSRCALCGAGRYNNKTGATACTACNTTAGYICPVGSIVPLPPAMQLLLEELSELQPTLGSYTSDSISTIDDHSSSANTPSYFSFRLVVALVIGISLLAVAGITARLIHKKFPKLRGKLARLDCCYSSQHSNKSPLPRPVLLIQTDLGGILSVMTAFAVVVVASVSVVDLTSNNTMETQSMLPGTHPGVRPSIQIIFSVYGVDTDYCATNTSVVGGGGSSSTSSSSCHPAWSIPPLSAYSSTQTYPTPTTAPSPPTSLPTSPEDGSSFRYSCSPDPAKARCTVRWECDGCVVMSTDQLRLTLSAPGVYAQHVFLHITASSTAGVPDEHLSNTYYTLISAESSSTSSSNSSSSTSSTNRSSSSSSSSHSAAAVLQGRPSLVSVALQQIVYIDKREESFVPLANTLNAGLNSLTGGGVGGMNNNFAETGLVGGMHPRSLFRKVGQVGYGVYPIQVIKGDQRADVSFFPSSSRSPSPATPAFSPLMQEEGNQEFEQETPSARQSSAGAEVGLSVSFSTPNIQIVRTVSTKYNIITFIGSTMGLFSVVLVVFKSVLRGLETLFVACRDDHDHTDHILRKAIHHIKQETRRTLITSNENSSSTHNQDRKENSSNCDADKKDGKQSSHTSHTSTNKKENTEGFCDKGESNKNNNSRNSNKQSTDSLLNSATLSIFLDEQTHTLFDEDKRLLELIEDLHLAPDATTTSGSTTFSGDHAPLQR